MKPRKLLALSLLLHTTTAFLLCAQELLFHAPFEDSLNAKVAQGAAEPAGKKGAFTFDKGVFGNALKVGATNSYLFYNGDKNVRADEGTVCLWLQNEWEPTDNKFHLFWSFLGHGRFMLYKYGGGDNNLIFYVQGDGQPDERFITIQTKIADWKPGQPHHIAATWTAGLIRLFVDGNKVAELADPKLLLPDPRPGSAFFVGDFYHPEYGTQREMSGKADTLIRDFQIHGKALSAEQIADVAGLKKKLNPAADPAVSRPVTAPPFVVVPRARTSPRVDGNFSLDEWRDAAAFTGFVDMMRGGLSDLQTTALLTYDADKLYMAFYSILPKGHELLATTDTRDGQTWSDESFEIILDPTASRADGRAFHFIGNSRGIFYDDKDRDVTWNGSWEYRSEIQENWRGVGLRCWAVEVAIPFAELGRKAPSDGERWTANFGHTWIYGQQYFTSWASPPEAQYFCPANLGLLEFREKAPAFQWTSMRDVSSGEPSLEMFWRSEHEGRFEIGGERKFALPAAPRTPERLTGSLDLAGQAKGVLDVKATEAGAASPLYTAQIPYVLDLAPLRVFLSPVPSRDQLIVDVDPVRFRSKWKQGWALDIDLKDHTNKIVSHQTIPNYEPPFARAEIPTAPLATGKYQVVTTLRDATGKVTATEQTAYEKKPRPAWFNNQIGKTDKVIKPWTPVKVEKSLFKTKGFSVWGREYRYERSLLPSQITSLGTNLLAAPIRLTGLTGSAASIRVDHQKSSAVNFTTRSADVTAHNRLEFDGMIWCEVTLPAGRVDSLSLEIPLRPEVATLYHPSSAEWAVAGSEPGATPQKWNGSWKQCMWLGNENVGLSWFAESDQFWSLSDPKHAFEIERRADATVLRINLVTKPKTYATAPTFRFGLQATPMRPAPVGWRGWQFPAGAGYNPDPDNPQKATHAISWWMEWSPRIASPFEWKPNMKDLVARNHKFGIKVIPYHALLALNENAPDVPDWKAEWLIKPQIEAGGEQGQRCLYVNVKGSFADYFLYGMREEVRAAGWDGMYFDFCQGAIPDANELHGSGYVDDDGKRHPTYDILAQREFLKRLIAMFQDEFGNDEPIIMVHLSANKIPPIHSFCNVYFDGEQHAFVPKVEDDYTKILSLDTFRSEFLCQQFGGVPVLLPELNHLQVICEQSKDPETKAKGCARWLAATDTMLIYPLLHGTLFSPGWLDQDYLKTLRESRTAFGMSDARFIGYWENNPAIQLAPSSATLKASVYAKDDKLWLVVGNLGEEPVSATVALDVKSLSRSLDPQVMEARNIFGRGSMKLEKSTVDLEVPRKSLRVIELRTNPK